MIKFLAHKGPHTLISSTGFMDIPTRTPVGVDIAIINGGSFNGFIDSGILRMFQTADEAWAWINSDGHQTEHTLVAPVIEQPVVTEILLATISAAEATPEVLAETPIVSETVVDETPAEEVSEVQASVDAPVEQSVEVAQESQETPVEQASSTEVPQETLETPVTTPSTKRAKAK